MPHENIEIPVFPFFSKRFLLDKIGIPMEGRSISLYNAFLAEMAIKEMRKGGKLEGFAPSAYTVVHIGLNDLPDGEMESRLISFLLSNMQTAFDPPREIRDAVFSPENTLFTGFLTCAKIYGET
jgi:hypothetical protein